jgi:glucose/arabinose dehydrogenase
MRQLLAPLLLAALVVAGCTATASGGSVDGSPIPSSVASRVASDIVASNGLVDIGAGVQGPVGLTATVYATGLKNVAAFAVDADGRLWAATAAYDDAGTDRLVVIDRAGATPTTVLTGLHTVLGLVWSDGTLYVASAGRVDAYTGLAGATFATHHAVLILPVGVGEVNGLAMSPEGRLVLGVSAPCDACTPTTDRAAAVLSFEPDGSDVQVLASGIRAPIGLAYVAATGDLLVTMNQQDQLGDATPGDSLAIVTAGQDWGFPACSGQASTACAGVPTPLAELDRHAAVSAVAVVDGTLGSAVGTAAVVAEWSTGKVVRVGLNTTDTPVTSTGVSTLLTGVGQPVAVATAPDGSLLVGDWASGTIYRIATG